MGIEQREHIKTVPNDFSNRQDVIIRLIRQVAGLRVCIDYIPDRYLLLRPSLTNWLKSYDKLKHSPEWLVVNLLDDINNEAVPRWVRVTCYPGQDETIIIEDQQPHWRGSPMLNRLGSI